jgi:hypothetical protein
MRLITPKLGAWRHNGLKLSRRLTMGTNPSRRGGRVVDRVALEMRSTRKCTGGSNPSLSANLFYMKELVFMDSLDLATLKGLPFEKLIERMTNYGDSAFKSLSPCSFIVFWRADPEKAARELAYFSYSAAFV